MSNSILCRAGTMDTSEDNMWASTYKTLAVLTVAAVLVVGQMYIVLPLYEDMAKAFGVQTTLVAWTSTGFGLSYAAGFLVAGPLCDRFGPKRTIVYGLLTTAITTGFVSLAQTFPQAVIFRVLQGLAAASFAPSAFSYVALRVRPERRTFVLSCVTSSMFASAPIVQVISEQVNTLSQWRTVFVLFVPLLLSVALTLAYVLLPQSSTRKGPLFKTFSNIPELAKNPRLFFLYLSTGTVMAGFVGIYTALALAGPASIADLSSKLYALRLASLPGILAAPLVMSVLPPVRPISRAKAGLVVASVAALAAGFHGGDVIWLGIVLGIFTFAVAFSAPALVEIIGDSAGSKRGVATALYAFSMFFGGSLGGQAITPIVDFGFDRIVLLIGCVLAIGTGLAHVSHKVRSRAVD